MLASLYSLTLVAVVAPKQRARFWVAVAAEL